MYHSVYFGNMNSFSDWHLVPDSRPVIAQPEPKVTTVDIPGGQGILDLSEVLTNYPLYSNRSGSLSFHVLNGYGDWKDRHQEIANYIHGKNLTMSLEDDPDWYYEGRFKFAWESPNDGTWSRVTIDYDLDPFKRSADIYSTSVTSTANGSKEVSIPFDGTSMPIVAFVNIPTMSATSLTFSLENPELGIGFDDYSEEIGVAGTSFLYTLPLSNMSGSNACRIKVTTNGAATAFTINYRKAAL